MTKALKHTDGRIIVVKSYAIRGASSQDEDFAHEREGEMQATMYKDSQQALRDLNGTLDEYERTIRKHWNIPDVISKMTMTSALPLGEAIHEAVYDFVLAKIGAGWSKI